MSRLAGVLVLALALAGCGVDGPPEPPEPKAATPAVALSGTVKLGIAGGSG